MLIKNTCKWVFGIDRPSLWDNFREWLQSGQGFYWIKGKPGSGKSTLMRFINHGQRTANLEKAWQRPTHIRPPFFFWRAGNGILKSIFSVFHGVLHQILSQAHQPIPILFPLGEETAQSWTISRLQEVIGRIADHQECPTLLLDGLNKFEGDTDDLLKFLTNLVRRPNIRCLVTSR